MLQFMDCSNCGKRVRTTALQCHHCHQPLVSTVGQKQAKPPRPAAQGEEDSSRDADQAHYAISGGYDTHNDDFDYDEYLAEEFPEQADKRHWRVKPWVWITAWLLITATLLPFFYYFLVG